MKKLVFAALVLNCLKINAQCWTPVWTDEFNGTALNTADWNHWIGPAYNNELQYYTDRPANVAVNGGSLKLIAKQEAYQGYNYTSGRIDTRLKFGFTYGKIEARMKIPAGQGYWPAFWLLPTSGNWPEGGEMDIMEILGHQPNKTYGTCHYQVAGQHQSMGSSFTLPSGDFTSFHTFGFEWTSTTLKWTIDGTAYYTVTKTQVGSANWPFKNDFYVIFNLAVGGDWPGPPNGSTQFPGTTEVDWVRVYQKNVDIRMVGPELVEPNTSANYKLPTWSGATYNWTTSTGGSIASGQGTPSVNVNWAAGGDRTVTCSFTNTCGPRTTTKAVKVTPNLWLNPSFELGTAEWEFYASSGGAGTFKVLSQAGAPNGTKVGRVVVTALGQDFWNIQLHRPNIFVKKDTSYTFSFWAKATAAGKHTQVNFLNPNNYTNYAWQNITLTTVWTKYTLTFIAPYTGNLLFTQDFGFQTGTFFTDNYIFGRTSQLFAPPTTDERSAKNLAAGQVEIWPNPAGDAAHFRAKFSGKYRLLDGRGRVVATGQFVENEEVALPTNALATGMYLLETEAASGEISVQKFLKN